MFYRNLKKFSTLWKFLTWSKDYLNKLSRFKDVIMMMILFHVCPEQTYRFATRKTLPSKKNRFSKESKPIIPFDLLKSKSSNISIMKEINTVGIGSSFDMNNIKDLKGPTFLLPAYGPLRIDNNGKIFNSHINSGTRGIKISTEELFNDQTNKVYKNNNIIYVTNRKLYVEKLKKMGAKAKKALPEKILNSALDQEDE